MSKLFTLLSEPTPFMVVEDSLVHPGQSMLRYFLRKWITANQRHNHLWVLSFDSPSEDYKALLRRHKTIEKDFVLIDCYSDPLGWEQPSSEDKPNANAAPFARYYRSTSASADQILALLRRVHSETSTGEPTAVTLVIDSLNTLLLRIGEHSTFRLLHALKQLCGATNTNSINVANSNNNDTNKGTITALFHLDAVHSSSSSSSSISIVQRVEQMASTIFAIHPDDERDSLFGSSSSSSFSFSPLKAFGPASRPAFQAGQERTCYILNKRVSGRVSRETQLYVVNADGELSLVKQNKNRGTPSSLPSITKQASKLATTTTAKKADDPTKDLTFSLSRTKEEEEARRSVVLPYTQVVQEHGRQDTSGGDIYFDEEDEDFEDPDGDLDI